MAPDVFLGGSVNFWSGEREYSWRYSEIKGVYDVENLVEEGDLWEVVLPDFHLDTHFREKYSGVNFTLGALLKQGKKFRFGGVIKSPVTLKGKREWDYVEYEEFPAGYEEFQEDPLEDSGSIDHKIRSPWVFRFGSAVHAGPVLLTGDVEFHNYGQMKYKTAPPEGLQTMSEVNLDLRRNYRSTFNYHIGCELTIPQIGVLLRGGYGFYGSPLKNTGLDLDRRVIALGAGFTFSQGLRLDVAYATSSWDSPPDDVVEMEKIGMNRVLLTFSYLK
jgi:long-subunit fatty acid transport protein